MNAAEKVPPATAGSAEMKSRAEHLRKVTLFADIRQNEGAIETLAHAMQTRTFGPGGTIIHEGETGSEMFLLIEGQASVYKSTAEGEPYKVAILDGQAHSFFGEGALLDSEARSATIKADTHCHCLVLKRSSFEKFSLANPEWALPVFLRIARTVMGRLRKSNHDMTLLYNALVAEIRGS